MLPRNCLALLTLLGLLLAGLVLPVRAQPRRDEDPEPPPRSGSIEGTTWTGTSNGRATTYRYLKGGVLEYKSTPRGIFRKGTWKQTGRSIYMEMNNKYAEYTGTIKGNEIEGTASNRRGMKWTWKVRKQ